MPFSPKIQKCEKVFRKANGNLAVWRVQAGSAREAADTADTAEAADENKATTKKFSTRSS